MLLKAWYQGVHFGKNASTRAIADMCLAEVYAWLQPVQALIRLMRPYARETTQDSLPIFPNT